MNLARAIAVAQTCPAAGDVAANISDHLALVRLAAGEGAEVVVFPELSLTGYELDLAPSLAFAARDPRLGPLSDAAAKWGITILAGAPVALGSGLHIGTFVVRPDGSAGLYTKRRLGAFSETARVDGTPPVAEGAVFVPGPHDPLIATGDTWAAAAICADTGDPAHPRAAADRGAGAYLASMFVIPSDHAADATRLAQYASEHKFVVAMANYGAPTGGLNAAGRSAIWNPAGRLLVELAPSGAGVAVALETSEGWQTRARTMP
jgi:predicted amidohydrolase